MATIIFRPHELPKPCIVFRDGGWRVEVRNVCGDKALMPQRLWGIYFKTWDVNKARAHVRKLNRREQ